jgi:cytoskeletal protein CcmA (bactofilin family)
MAVTDATRVDLLLKKLSGVAKTDTSDNKSVSNESIASPSLNRGDSIWLNAYLIPSTANSIIGTVTSYIQNNRRECTADTTTQKMSGSVYPTWKTGLTDWIPPEFDSTNLNNTYRVRVYYGPAGISDPSQSGSGATEIFADGNLGTGEWYFDYQAGILHFYGGTRPTFPTIPPTGMTSSDVIYVLGYRYVGPKGFNSVFQVDTPVMRGNLSLPTLITLRGDTVVEKNLTVTEDLEIQGGDLTTNQTTFNLLNTTATTVNFAGAGTTVNIGAATGTTNVKNDLDVKGDVKIQGDDLKTTAPTFNLLPDTATTVNFAGAATSLVLGATTGTTKIRNDLDVDGNFNVDGDFHIGKNLDVDGDLNIDGGDLTVSTSTFNIANANATTINFAGDATNVQIGSDEGDTNVNNNLTVDGVTNVQKELTVEGDTTVNSKLTVEGIVDVNNSLYVTGSTDVSESLKVQGSTSVQKELVVEGNTQMNKGLSVEGELKAGKLVDTVIDCGEY